MRLPGVQIAGGAGLLDAPEHDVLEAGQGIHRDTADLGGAREVAVEVGLAETALHREHHEVGAIGRLLLAP